MGDLSFIPGLGKSPGEGNGYPLQYFGLENSMDCIVHRVKKSDMNEQLSLFMILLMSCGLVLLIFYLVFLHVCSSVTLICNFTFLDAFSSCGTWLS